MVAITGRGDLAQNRLETGLVRCRDHDLEGLDVLLEPATTLRPGDGHDILSPRVTPGEKELGETAALCATTRSERRVRVRTPLL